MFTLFVRCKPNANKYYLNNAKLVQNQFFFTALSIGAGVDEDGQFVPHSPDEEGESEESDEDESSEPVNFSEVTEVRFPGEVGPLGDRRLCKIRCVKGKWVGPLCATNEEGIYYLQIMKSLFT